MTRRWINSMDVPVSADGTPLFGRAGSSDFPGGQRTCSSTSMSVALASESTPCHAVWIGAIMTTEGAASNTKPVLLGDANNQNMPLMSSNMEGMVIPIDDASKLHIRVLEAGEGVEYRIFK